MIEQLKTILLFALIGLSLFLTYSLWYGQKPAELIADDVYEQVDAESPRPLEKTIVPEIVVVPVDDGVFLYQKGDPDFDLIWDELSRLLQKIDNSFVSSAQSGPPEDATRCLSSHFEPLLPVGVDMPWLTGLPGGAVKKIDLYCFEDSYWLVIIESEGAERYLELEEDKVKGLNSVLADLAGDKEAEYSYLNQELVLEKAELEIDIIEPVYVPVEEMVMPKLNLKAEKLDQELLLKTFFVDYNLARVIEERDGGRLYTDGEKGLRLTDVGFEYSYPRLEEGQTSASYSEALRSSNSLISYHGGWPENLRLEKIGLTSRGGSFFYESEWQMYYNGYPLKTVQQTRFSFNDLGLIHFTRFLFEPAAGPETTADELALNAEKEKVFTAPWYDVVSRAVEVMEERIVGPASRLRLETIELVYVVTGTKAAPKGTPAWVVIINGEEIILEAGDLEIIDEEDLL